MNSVLPTAEYGFYGANQYVSDITSGIRDVFYYHSCMMSSFRGFELLISLP